MRLLLTHDHQKLSTMIEPLRGYSVNCLRVGRELLSCACMFACPHDCCLASSVRSQCSRPLDQAVECGADDDSTPSGAARDCVSVFPYVSRRSSWTHPCSPDKVVYLQFFHVTSTQFSAHIYSVPCSAVCNWLCQSASREFLFICCCKLIFLLLHFSSFPIHRSYALVCSCVDVDVKLTDTHWACPLGIN